MKNRNLEHKDDWATPDYFKKEIRFIDGRIKFKGINTKGELVDNKAGMHDSMIVIFDGTQ